MQPKSPIPESARFTPEQEAIADAVARLIGYRIRRASSPDGTNPASVLETDCFPDTSVPTVGTGVAPDSTQPDRGES